MPNVVLNWFGDRFEQDIAQYICIPFLAVEVSRKLALSQLLHFIDDVFPNIILGCFIMT